MDVESSSNEDSLTDGGQLVLKISDPKRFGQVRRLNAQDHSRQSRIDVPKVDGHILITPCALERACSSHCFRYPCRSIGAPIREQKYPFLEPNSRRLLSYTASTRNGRAVLKFESFVDGGGCGG